MYFFWFQVLSLEHTDIKIQFIKQVLTCPGFELHILPKFLKLCRSCEPSASLLQLLAELVIEKSPPCHSGLELSKWKKYPLDLTNSALVTNMYDSLNNIENLEDFVCSVLVLPHVKSIDDKLVKEKFHDLVMTLANDGNDNALFALALLTESAVHMNFASELDKDVIVSQFLMNKSDLAALRMLDLYLSTKKLNCEEKQEMFQMFLDTDVHGNLSSPHHKVINNSKPSL